MKLKINLSEFKDKLLSTDEVSLVKNYISKKIKELEDFDYQTGKDYLLFKWGTLKSWQLNSPRGKDLLKEYFEIGQSMSAMSQKDTKRQTELICEMIDECDGVLKEDWGGNYLTKSDAKTYILAYGK